VREGEREREGEGDRGIWYALMHDYVMMEDYTNIIRDHAL
jgi:hypothetical protein